MKLKLLVCLSLAISEPAIAADEYIDNVPDRIYETQQSQQALMKRAELCIVQTIKSDEVRTIGTSNGRGGWLSMNTARQEAVSIIPSLPLIKFRDAEAGVIYINNRIDYKADFSIMHTAQTEMVLSMKDNKFKIGNRNIRYLQKNVGYGTPPEFKPLPAKKFGSSVPEATVTAINEVTERLAACLIAPANDAW